jgi:hypothetical protein
MKPLFFKATKLMNRPREEAGCLNPTAAAPRLALVSGGKILCIGFVDLVSLSRSQNVSVEKSKATEQTAMRVRSDVARRVAAAAAASDEKASREPPDHYICPITDEIMQDPVMALDG